MTLARGTPLEYSDHQLFAVGIAAFCVGFLKTTFSSGVGVFLVPAMIMFWPTRFIIGIVAVVMWVTDFFATPMFWKQWEARFLRFLVPGFYVGVAVGVFALVRLTDYWLRKGIGLTCVCFACLLVWRELKGEMKPPPVHPAVGVGVGVGGGIVSAMFHSGGLVLSLFFISQGLSKTAVVASIIITWLWVNPFKVASLWVGGVVQTQMLVAGVLAFPLAWAGSWCGRETLRRIPQKAFTLIFLLLSLVTALRLLSEPR